MISEDGIAAPVSPALSALFCGDFFMVDTLLRFLFALHQTKYRASRERLKGITSCIPSRILLSTRHVLPNRCT